MSSFLNSPHCGFRGLCWLMAMLMFTTPSLPVLAQESGRSASTYLLPQACVVVSMRPRQLLTSPAMQMLPIEVLQAAALQHASIDPLEVESLLLSVEPPMVGPPNYSLLTVFTPDYQAKLHPRLTAHTQPGQLDGREYLKSQHPLLPSILIIDGNTMLAAPDMTLHKLVAQESSAEDGLLISRLKGAAADDLYVAVDLESLRPLINQLMMQAQGEVPAELQPFLAAPDLIRLVEARLNLTGTGPTELVVEANSAADAAKLIAMLEQIVDMWRSEGLATAAELKQNPDPVQQALGRYQERIMSQTTDMLVPEQDGARLIVFHQDPGEGDTDPLTTVAIIGTLVGLLLPAVQAAREAARRNTSMNNMKQIMVALHNYHDMRKHLPAHASFNDAGKPLLSWRVLILPMIGESELYEQFHLDEPWDSEHNRPLVSQMPEIYLDPSSKFRVEDGKTHYLGAKGKEYAFDGTEKGRQFKSFHDGISNSIMVLQVNDQRAAVWTKPDDWERDPERPLQGLTGSVHPGIFLAGFADAHVQVVATDIDVEVFQHLLTIAGGEVLNPDE